MTSPLQLDFPHRWQRTWKIHAQIDAILAQLRRVGTCLHLGCGQHPISGVINCDLYSPLADQKLDATDLSAYADGSVDMIEHHHMIEHLSREECERGMREWSRVLKSGGHLVVTAPDLSLVLRRWQRMPASERWDYGLKMIYGSQENPGMFHKNGFTAARLAEVLSQHGVITQFSYACYPLRPTPSFISISRKVGAQPHGQSATASSSNGV